MGIYIYSVRTKSINVTMGGETTKVHALAYLSKSTPPDWNEKGDFDECRYNRMKMAAADAAWARRGVTNLEGTLVYLDEARDGTPVLKYGHSDACCYDSAFGGETIGYLRKTGRGKWTLASSTYQVEVGTMKQGHCGPCLYIRTSSPVFFNAGEAVAWAKANVQPGEQARVQSCHVGGKSAVERVAEPEAEAINEVADILLHGPWPCSMWAEQEPMRAQTANALVARGLVEIYTDKYEGDGDLPHWHGRPNYRLSLHGLMELAGLKINNYRLRVELTRDEVVFSGGKFGSHSVARLSSDLARVKAHWEGYCEAQQESARAFQQEPGRGVVGSWRIDDASFADRRRIGGRSVATAAPTAKSSSAATAPCTAVCAKPASTPGLWNNVADWVCAWRAVTSMLASPAPSAPRSARKLMNTVPNLDAMTKEDLGAFWGKYHRASRKDAEALVGDRRKGFTVIAAALANYAINKATAMGCREKGDITAAQVYEHSCDLCYERIPEDLRW